MTTRSGVPSPKFATAVRSLTGAAVSASPAVPRPPDQRTPRCAGKRPRAVAVSTASATGPLTVAAVGTGTAVESGGAVAPASASATVSACTGVSSAGVYGAVNAIAHDAAPDAQVALGPPLTLAATGPAPQSTEAVTSS